MDTIRWLARYIRPYRGSWIFASVLTIVVALLNIVTPYISGMIVDLVIQGGQDNLLLPLLFVMIAGTVFRTWLRYLYQIRFEYISQDVLFQIRDDLYTKFQELDFSFFNHTRTGDIMARMTGDTDAIRHSVAWAYFNILDNVVLFVSALIFLGTVNMKLTLALLVVTPFIAVLTIMLSSKANRAYFEIRESFSRLNSMVEENIRGNQIVKAFANERFEEEKFDKVNQGFRDRNLESAAISSRYLPLIETFAGFMSVIAVGFGGWLAITGEMSVGNLVTFTGLIWMINVPMRNLGGHMNDLQKLFAGTIKIREMLMVQPEIPIEERKEFDYVEGRVEFQNVSFAFPDDPENLVLDDISFKAEPGQEIGIIGETGSGKSTLVNLISRFFDPTKGRILIDDVDIREWNVIDLRRHITVVMQDAFLFSDTIKSNISFGMPQTPLEDVEEVADVADASEFIERMPEKYETYLGEQGSGLSGGQKQRLSLARGLLKDPAILILDDTTSALDMETEARIQKGMEKISRQRTSFIIANRLSSVKNADQIFVLSKGKIIERGQHDDLLAKKGAYFRIYEDQLGQAD
ncbi:ATP-binding cassette, subfamily B [Atopostipes suicloacalis DSM 15692]|uniref:ATP-binding cassette, subfamily B n=1 Tax=Atopostipes suicloacalis DSM 15692 TaxID=1121025 RepID=A0A1M4YCR8_9LACT|nr:ABC transporter ATP-binding protein [Atopostipes suicloacalis]SHF03527.1 ATP-binding cassette, subfamily B [Atopostipes suicloacalis DSM 15692]